jgi:hypothetical protein
MPVADHDVVSAGHAAAWHSHHQVAVHPAAVRQAVGVEQPVQRVNMTEVEQLELRHHLPLLRELVELGDERPRVHEHVVTEVRRAHRQRARVGLGVEDLEALFERVVHGAAGGQLDDQRGGAADGVHRLLQPPGVERRLVLRVPDVEVDHRRARRFAAHSRLDQLLDRGGQIGHVRLGRLGAGRSNGDQRGGVGDPGRHGHGVIVPDSPACEQSCSGCPRPP